MPASTLPAGKSCLQGDSIVCGYHGITFGPDGRCTDVPTQDFVPPAGITIHAHFADQEHAGEEIEKILQLVGHPTELMNKSDRNAVEGCRMLQAMMDAEGAAVAERVKVHTHIQFFGE